MWSQQDISSHLHAIGLRAGDSVLVLSSLRAVGATVGGATGVLNALLDAIGPDGNLLFPSFTLGNIVTAKCPPLIMSPADERLAAALTTPFDAQSTPADTNFVGALPEIARRHPDSYRSLHPLYSFVALGADSEFFTKATPHHYPLGSESPIARLFQKDGKVLLLGVPYSANIALHLAEIWAEVPYTRRTLNYRTSGDQMCEMMGVPGCRIGFCRLEPLMKQSRLQRAGTIGSASSRLFSMRMATSLATTYLYGEPSGLLCRNPECDRCTTARKLCATAESTSDDT